MKCLIKAQSIFSGPALLKREKRRPAPNRCHLCFAHNWFLKAESRGQAMLKAKGSSTLVSRPIIIPSEIHSQQSFTEKLLSLLKKCTSTTLLQQIHTQMLINAIQKPNFLLSKVIDLKNLAYASLLFSQTQQPNDYAFNVMIRGLTTTWQNYSATLHFYYKMKFLGLRPNKFTYPFLFISCANLLELSHGQSAHSSIFKLGLDVDPHTTNSLITMYSRCSELGSARKVFDEITERDLVSWNSMISGYSKMGHARNAVGLFGKMREEGFVPDEMTLVSVLGACGDLGDLSLGKWVEGFVIKQKMEFNSYIGSALIDMYGKCGDLASARRVFDGMLQKDVVTWNAMITGYAQNGMSDEAIKLFYGMKDAGVNPNTITLAGVLSACASIGALDLGKWIDTYASQRGLQHNIFVSTALVDMYAKCGSLDDAQRVFENMPIKNEVSWNAMISAFAFHGRSQEALSLFERMSTEGMDASPNDVTFVGVLSACVHAGLVGEGWRYFNLMSLSYGLTPKIEHYSCMVDLLARAGQLYEAWDFIEKMPEKPDEIVLGALLGACQKCKNLDVTEKVMQLLLQMEPSNSGNYIISSKIYAKSRRWDESAKMRVLMRERGVNKTPGCSWIDIEGQLHEFLAGDDLLCHSIEIHQVFELLNVEMKREGYIPKGLSPQKHLLQRCELLRNHLVNNAEASLLGGNALVESIRALMKRDWEVRSRHVFRESNAVADCSASMVRGKPIGEEQFVLPPLQNSSGRRKVEESVAIGYSTGKAANSVSQLKSHPILLALAASQLIQLQGNWEPRKKRMGAEKKLQKSYFDVLGLCCSSEVPLIENILKSIEGVKEVSVIVPTRTVIVLHDDLLVSQLQIVKALNQARLEANVRAHGEIKYQKKWPSPFAIACGLLLFISFFKYVYHPLQWVAVAAVAVGVCPILSKGYAAITHFRLDINILMLIAVIGSIAMKDYTEAATIVFLFTIAEWLESRASHKATAVMSSLMSISPQKAVIAESGEEVDVDEVKLNTVLAVKAGEVVPIDGIVVDGKCEVDEKTLTGESLPVPKEKDSTVWAGTINLNGYISVKTTAVAEDCVVAKLAKLVEEAQNSKSATQRFIDKCARFYTPTIIVVSTGIAVIPAALRVHNLQHWLHLALVVLVSACPCALILSTPVATFCALTRAATSGLLVKGGDYLETLSKINITAFDKTGTLTRGEFVVTDFQSLSGDISFNTLLYWVSSIESKSSHPMAAALIEYGRSHSIEPKPETVDDYQNFPGEGIYGRIDGRDIYIGSRKVAERAHGTAPNLEGNMMQGKTIGYVFSGGNPAGIFSLSDACRTGASEALNELKSMGIKTALLTGDNQATAMHVQEQLGNGLDVIHAELLPEDKARLIEEFKKEGPTAMIGDGINDAPALATADIGISMGISGSALATETGHVILMSNDIRKIPKAIQLARKAHNKVIQNVVLSISTKVAILALAFAGHPLVWAAVLADVGTCLLVIFNSMLLLQGTHKHAGKCCKSSAASHMDQHGCKTNHCHSSHNHQHGKVDKKVQEACEPQQCSSKCCASSCQSSTSNSCGSDKCAGTHDTSPSHEAKHCDQGSCSTTNHKIEAKNPSNYHSGLCVESNHLHGENPRDLHHSCNQEAAEDDHCHSSCHDNHTDLKALGHFVEHCCLEGTNPEGRPGSSECFTDDSEAPHTAINMAVKAKHETCTRVEKREFGGCCKSYMKECCGKHGYSRIGLTEIVTE
ncbi:hypothetical protein V6N13_076411 [Hibiscus sabdariffa]